MGTYTLVELMDRIIFRCCFVFGSFLTSLISAAPTRLGKNGVAEVMASPWLAGVPWERIREVPAPYVTEGAHQIKVSLLSNVKGNIYCAMTGTLVSPLDRTTPFYRHMVFKISKS